jgi:hypothetical protein
MRCIFFILPNPSSSTMALRSIKPLTEMSTRNLPGGVKGGRGVRLTILPPPVSRLSRKMWEPPLLTTLRAFTACYIDSFTFILRLREGGGINSHIRNLGTGRSCAATSRPRHLPARSKNSPTFWIGVGVGSRIDLDFVERRRIFCPCRDSSHNSLGVQSVA